MTKMAAVINSDPTDIKEHLSFGLGCEELFLFGEGVVAVNHWLLAAL